MKEKDLKHLNREELLELLLIQTTENEKLKQKLKKTEEELVNRKIDIEKCGSLAEAAIRINGVFRATEAAARQYLENIARMEKETRQKCKKLLEDAEYEAAAIKEKRPKDDVTNAIVKEIYDFIDEKK